MKAKKMLIGVLAGAALIGAGSATWKFAGSASSAESGKVVIAGYEIVGDVTISGEFILTVDDTPSITTNTVKATYNNNGGKTDAGFEKTYTIAFSDNLKDYLTFTNTEGSWTDGTSITTPTVAWASADKNPSTKDAYDTMVSALSGATITITFTATSANGDSGTTGGGSN